MKILVPVLFIVIAFVACDKTKELLTFDMSISQEFTLPGFPDPLVDTTISVTTPDIPTNSDKVFKDNGTSTDLIKEVKLKEAKLTVVSPAAQTMDFLKSIELYISAPGQPEIKLAGKDPVPNGTGSTLVLDAPGTALDEYIKAQTIKLRIVIGADEGLPQDTDIRADLTFSVQADPF